MEERKHIDRLFQEKFKDFEASPREEVWKNISSRLQEKQRKKRVIPLWYKLAGVAAILAFFFSYTTGLFKFNNLKTPQTTAIFEEDSVEISLASQAYTENMIRSSIILQALMQDTQNKQAIEEQAAFVQAQQKEEKIFRTPEPTNLSIVKTYSPSEFKNKTSEIAEEIAAVENKTTTSNQLKDLPVPGKTSEEEVAAVEKTKLGKRLRISPMAAPIYYDNLGSGNAIDQRFNNNDNSSEVTISYGINFAYQISEKLKIRSGISKVDMSYNTNNIAFIATVNPVALSGINYGGNIPNYRIENTGSRRFSNVNASSEFNRASLAAPANGYLNQQIGFIEVPLEIEYVLLDKKIGLNIIGGGSTLFLNNNMISLNSAQFSTDLGEANNLNNLSFTTNIGLGLDYNISEKFELNFEPIFKYQLNTFNGSGNVNPYFFGVYSGFSFKF